MTDQGGTIHAIIEANARYRPWKGFPNGHWTSLIMAGGFALPSIIAAIRWHDIWMVAAAFLLMGVFFVFWEVALYLRTPLPEPKHPAKEERQVESDDRH